MKFYLIILSALISFRATGQEIVVKGKFVGDSIRIGEPVPYILTASYPSSYQVLFPDSLFDLKPFEYDRRNYFPTVTTNGVSYDSAVYWVSSFEIDQVQYLSIPILQLINGDSLFFRPEVDSVFLSSSTKSVEDSISNKQLPLKTDTTYQAVNFLFNYPALILGVGIFVLVLIAVWLIFGKRIRQWWSRRRLMKSFQDFEQTFQQLLERIRERGEISEAEQAIRVWKKYLENLEGIPYTRFTTKEIVSLEQHQSIQEALRSIDRRIYGRVPSKEVNEYFTLKSFSEDQYLKKLEELKK